MVRYFGFDWRVKAKLFDLGYCRVELNFSSKREVETGLNHAFTL